MACHIDKLSNLKVHFFVAGNTMQWFINGITGLKYKEGCYKFWMLFTHGTKPYYAVWLSISMMTKPENPANLPIE